jgi:hypothetical protein
MSKPLISVARAAWLGSPGTGRWPSGGAKNIDDTQLMQQAFQDKLAGKSNQQSAAMRELQRRHGL